MGFATPWIRAWEPGDGGVSWRRGWCRRMGAVRKRVPRAVPLTRRPTLRAGPGCVRGESTNAAQSSRRESSSRPRPARRSPTRPGRRGPEKGRLDTPAGWRGPVGVGIMARTMEAQMKLTDRVAIVTGGGSGIGAASALAFAGRGRASWWPTSTRRAPRRPWSRSSDREARRRPPARTSRARPTTRRWSSGRSPCGGSSTCSSPMQASPVADGHRGCR